MEIIDNIRHIFTNYVHVSPPNSPASPVSPAPHLVLQAYFRQ